MRIPAIPSSCRRCGAPLAAERSSWGGDGANAAWSCTRCGAVRFEIGAQRPGSTEVVVERGGSRGGYRANAGQGEVVLVRRWRRPIHALLLLAPLALITLITLLVLFVGVEALAPLAQFWFPLLGGTAVMTYAGLVGLVNTTRLEVHDGVLRVVHGPLPYKRGLTWPAADLTDVWTQHVRVSGAPDIYRLRVALKSGGELVIVDELPALEDGVFLEEKIAACASLGDRG